MSGGEVAFGVINAVLAIGALVLSIVFGVINRRDTKAAGASAANAEAIAERSAAAAEQSADAAARSAAEAKRGNELAIEAADRQRFVWSIDAFPGPGHVTYVLQNDDTDTAEDVVLAPGPPNEPGIVIPNFRDLPNGATIRGHGSHEFYTDPGLAEVPPRDMLLSWRGHENPPIALPSVFSPADTKTPEV